MHDDDVRNPEDPITTFRRLADPRRWPEPRSAPKVAVRPGEREPYVAFKGNDRSPSLDIRGRTIGHRIPWSYQPILTYTPRSFDHLILTVSSLVVIVRGVRIEPIADALGLQSCAFIQEYDPTYFLEPTDPNAPLVTSIESRLRHGMDEESA